MMALSNTGGFSSIIFLVGLFLVGGIQEAAFMQSIIKENFLVEEKTPDKKQLSEGV